MKIILSRKAWDSSYGKKPSPILPDGRLLPMPIPSKSSPIRYCDLSFHGLSVGELASSLTNGKQRPNYNCHLDPDIEESMFDRPPSWRPIFGQHSTAQSHLEKQGVGSGDLFLFFGWFRQTDWFGGQLDYVPDTPDRHILFGWLQVGEAISLSSGAAYPDWADYHPHLHGEWSRPNGLYLASEYLRIDGRATGRAGAGLFRHASTARILTEPGQKRSTWRLPAFFHEAVQQGGAVLTYHNHPERWRKVGEYTRLESVGRGQEFVFDNERVPSALGWLHSLLEV